MTKVLKQGNRKAIVELLTPLVSSGEMGKKQFQKLL
jgi:hypothetical protein